MLLFLQVLVGQCQAWTFRLVASLATTTTTEIDSLEAQMQARDAQIDNYSQQTGDIALQASMSCNIEGFKASTMEFRSRIDAAKENTAALVAYKVSIMLEQAPGIS